MGSAFRTLGFLGNEPVEKLFGQEVGASGIPGPVQNLLSIDSQTLSCEAPGSALPCPNLGTEPYVMPYYTSSRPTGSALALPSNTSPRTLPDSASNRLLRPRPDSAY